MSDARLLALSRGLRRDSYPTPPFSILGNSWTAARRSAADEPWDAERETASYTLAAFSFEKPPRLHHHTVSVSSQPQCAGCGTAMAS
jgi:hypothetical protein